MEYSSERRHPCRPTAYRSELLLASVLNANSSWKTMVGMHSAMISILLSKLQPLDKPKATWKWLSEKASSHCYLRLQSTVGNTPPEADERMTQTANCEY